MKLTFTKMHGIGNDYLYFNCLEQTIKNPGELSVRLSDRHFGVGGDGIILILPSQVADFRMRMFNADGSEGKMCGNGIRCVGKYLFDHGITKKTQVTIETLGGIKHLNFTIENGQVSLIQVDMGKAILTAREIPVLTSGDTFIAQPITVDGKEYSATCVSMGNPHAVLFVDEVDSLDLPAIGPKFEHHAMFPEGVNTEFVQVLSPTHLKMRVWERGSGETFACGTGACATVVASVLKGICPRNTEITVTLLGGDLHITYRDDERVFMRGPATTVFEGTLDV